MAELVQIAWSEGALSCDGGSEIDGVSLESTEHGLRLSVSPGVSVAQPIHLLHTKTEVASGEKKEKKELALHIEVGAGSDLILLEEYAAQTDQSYSNAIRVNLDADSKSSITYYKVQNEAKVAEHQSTLTVNLGEGSALSRCYVGMGANVSTDRVTSKMVAENASCDFSAFYYGAQQQTHEQEIDVQHLASHTRSEQHYRGIADDQSQIIFDGKVTVSEQVQGIVSHQKNQHLLLSEKAKSRAHPQLEIYSDDVVCSHGATTGQLDERALFYLRSRGVDEVLARTMLLEAFMSEVIDRVPHEVVRNRIRHLLTAEGVIA